MHLAFYLILVLVEQRNFLNENFFIRWGVMVGGGNNKCNEADLALAGGRRMSTINTIITHTVQEIQLASPD